MPMATTSGGLAVCSPGPSSVVKFGHDKTRQCVVGLANATVVEESLKKIEEQIAWAEELARTAQDFWERQANPWVMNNCPTPLRSTFQAYYFVVAALPFSTSTLTSEDYLIWLETILEGLQSFLEKIEAGDAQVLQTMRNQINRPLS